MIINSSTSTPTASDFYSDYATNNNLPQNYSISMSLANNSNSARVHGGTFNLKNKVNTWHSYEAELIKACTTKEKLKKAVVSMLFVGVIAAGVAAIVFGGIPGAVFGFIGLVLIGVVGDLYLQKKVFDHHINYNVFAPLTTPILFVYYMATYKSKLSKKIALSKQEAVNVANYVIAKHSDISQWLEQQQEETASKFTLEANKSPMQSDLADNRITLQRMKAYLDNQEKIKWWTDNLTTSFEEAQKIPAADLNS